MSGLERQTPQGMGGADMQGLAQPGAQGLASPSGYDLGKPDFHHAKMASMHQPEKINPQEGEPPAKAGPQERELESDRPRVRVAKVTRDEALAALLLEQLNDQLEIKTDPTVKKIANAARAAGLTLPASSGDEDSNARPPRPKGFRGWLAAARA